MSVREDDALSVFLYAHHRRRRAVRLGHDVKRTTLKIVAAENALTGRECLFVGPLREDRSDALIRGSQNEEKPRTSVSADGFHAKNIKPVG